MTVIPLMRAEFARLTASRLGILSLIALMTVPLFYGGLYLWGNHDPYSNLKNVPAALVVADSGATVDGKRVDYGRDAAKGLIKDASFGWVEVSASEAASGVRKGTYDFALEFPPAFSSDLASASGTKPVSASLELTTDDTNSYLSTTIAKQAAEAVRVEVAREVGAKASITLLDGVSSLRSGLITAQKGAGDLATGAASATTGASSLVSGTAALASGASSLSGGLKQLDGQASSLPASAAALSSGAATVSGYTTKGLGQVAVLQTALQNAGVTDPTVYADLQALGVSVGTANAYAGGVATGAKSLDASAPALAGAVHTAATGAAGLSTGAAQASSGASSLSAGVDQLAAGSSTLSDSLGDAVERVPATTASDRKTTANLIADPLTVKQDAVTQAADYGAGLAPFFLSLASWIGIYALFLLVRPLSRRALTAVRRPVRTMLAGWLVPAVLGVVQMIALFAIVTLALHLPVANPVGMLGFMAFVAITFAAIVLALNVLLGSVGQFLALIFMVVQLVVAGGTFPWQTLPGPLRALHEVLPMSHAVDGIRQLMYGSVGANFWSAVLPLLLWLVISLLVATLGALRQGRFRTLRELRPSAIGG